MTRLILIVLCLALAGCEPEIHRRQTFLNDCDDRGFTSKQCDFLWRAQVADRHYGCTVQQQAPNGECR